MLSVNHDAVDMLGQGVGSILAHVSRHWRFVACDMPVLWATFELSLYGTDPDARLLELYLSRSDGALLTVHVDATGGANEGAMGQRKINLLVQHAHPLRSLHFMKPLGRVRRTDLWLNVRMDGFKGNLRHLEIVDFGTFSSRMMDAFADTPLLHTAAFQNKRDAYLAQIPAAQIRTLHIGNRLFDAHLGHKYHNLTTLTCGPEEEFFGFYTPGHVSKR
ncbi:hypothetical protein B0H19DRAFT_321772 [Mycena capillaripes]|nr:hypothetical protein B0H19DRAFT_321772 [Mycena capillaripes]